MRADATGDFTLVVTPKLLSKESDVFPVCESFCGQILLGGESAAGRRRTAAAVSRRPFFPPQHTWPRGPISSRKNVGYGLVFGRAPQSETIAQLVANGWPAYADNRRGNSRSAFDIREGSTELTYRIEYSSATDQHLRVLTARQRSLVFDAVDEQLTSQPNVETRNRKPMRPNPLAPWELRIGDLRVYYDIIEEPEPRVVILAVGLKDRNRIVIGGEEIEL